MDQKEKVVDTASAISELYELTFSHQTFATDIQSDIQVAKAIAAINLHRRGNCFSLESHQRCRIYTQLVP